MTKSNEPAPLPPIWGEVATTTDDTERYARAQWAVGLVEDPGTGKRVPRFAYDLPWDDDSEATVNNILVGIIAAPSVEAATVDKELRKAADLIGEPLQVFDIRARWSDIDEGGWPFYLSMDVSVAGGPREVVNCGAQQVITTLWRLYAEGRLPIQGALVKLGTPTKGRNQPIGFQPETPLD